MPENKKIKAVLFDLGETLLNYGRFSTTKMFREGARSSYEFLQSCGAAAGGLGNFELYCWRNLLALWVRRFISRINRRDFNSLVLLRGVGRKKGVNLDKHQWREFAWQWYQPLFRIARIEPGTVEALSSLRKMGLKLGIVSNTFVNGNTLERHLEQSGLLEFFTVRVYSCEFDFRKPDARIFRIAAQRISEAFDNILFVGDRIEYDIQPTLKLGMKAVVKSAYTNISKRVPLGARRINSLSELPGIIEKINIELHKGHHNRNVGRVDNQRN